MTEWPKWTLGEIFDRDSWGTVLTQLGHEAAAAKTNAAMAFMFSKTNFRGRGVQSTRLLPVEQKPDKMQDAEWTKGRWVIV